MLTQVDKAMHSDGAKSGYVLINGSLPNPTDMLLVYSQDAFPLDYILYSGNYLKIWFHKMIHILIYLFNWQNLDM